MAKRGGKQTEKNFFPYRLPEMHFKTNHIDFKRKIPTEKVKKE